jgi:hypothetical protein
MRFCVCRTCARKTHYINFEVLTLTIVLDKVFQLVPMDNNQTFSHIYRDTQSSFSYEAELYFPLLTGIKRNFLSSFSFPLPASIPPLLHPLLPPCDIPDQKTDYHILGL